MNLPLWDNICLDDRQVLRKHRINAIWIVLSASAIGPSLSAPHAHICCPTQLFKSSEEADCYNTTTRSPHPTITSMESELFSYTSEGESERPPDSDIPSTVNGFSVTPEDAGILKGYLEEFQSSKTEARNRILETALGEVFAHRLKNGTAKFDKKVAKKVSLLRTFVGNVADRKRPTENPDVVLQPLQPSLSPIDLIYPEVVGSECVLS